MKTVHTLFVLLCVYTWGISQTYLGVSTSNYAGSMGTQLQPASFVDGRFVFDLNLVGFNNNTYQNFGYFDAKAMREAQGNGGYWWKKSFGDSTIYAAWASPDSTFMDRFIVRDYSSETKKVLGLYSNTQIDYLISTFILIPKSLLAYLDGYVQ